jgi:hypothetical protein
MNMEIGTPPGDDHLLSYLDGLLEEQQAKKLEEQIQSSSSLIVRLEELRVIHNALSASAKVEAPSRNFTERVMNQLNSVPRLSNISPKNGILLLGGILVAVSIALMLLKAGMFDSFNGAIALDNLPIKKEWIKNPLPSIPFNGKLMINVLLIVATGLSFVLLDRTIFRPLFGRRSGMEL